MKKFFPYCLVLSTFVFFTACKKESTNTNCASTGTLSVVQQKDSIQFTISGSSGTSYEISILQAGQTGPTNGNRISFVNTRAKKSIHDLSLFVNSGYSFYVRTICSDGSSSEWSTPQVLTISDFCPVAYNLSNSGGGFTWSTTGSSSAYYQVEYGNQGFSHGSGTLAQTTDTYYLEAAMQAGRIYDFYVRAYCNSSLGWSEWAGPYSLLCESTQNMCTAPSNIVSSVERDFAGRAVGANFQWNMNGESVFEYTAVNIFQTVSDGTIYTVTNGWPTLLVAQNTNFHFYVRAVCANGNRTSWTGPFLFNIGF